MPVIDLKPASQITILEDASLASFWTVHGAASATAALSDGSSGSYLENAAFSPMDDRLFSLGTVTLAANQRVTAIRLRVNMLKYTLGGGTPDASQPGLWTLYVYGSDIPSPSAPANLTGAQTGTNAHHWFPSGSGATYLGPRLQAMTGPDTYPNTGQSFYGGYPQYPWQYTYTQLNTPGIYYSGWHALTDNGGIWTQAVLNNMGVLITERATNGVFYGGWNDTQWADIAVEVDVRTQPSVVVANGVGNPLGATVTWASTMNDGDVQSAWEMAFYTQAATTVPGFDPSTTNPLYRVKGTGAVSTAAAAIPLVAGATYVAYVRVAKKMGVDTNGIFLANSRTYDWFSQWASNTVFISPVDTSTYIPQLPNEGVLGCHTWTVTGGSRGGTAIKADIPWNQIKWGRKLQEVSTAEVTFPRSACTTVPFLTTLKPWEHELAFWRDSESGPQLEWVGPIVGRRVTRDSITLRARDWWTIFEHRRVHGNYNLTGVELSTLYAAVALDALGADNTPKVAIVIHATGVTGDKQVQSSQYRRAADVLRELGRAGVDWTMVNRSILAGGVELGIPSCRLLLDDHVLEISGDENGESAATDVTVVGGKTTAGTQAVQAAALSGDPRGVLETIIQANDVQDDVSAQAYALSSLALLSGGVPRTYTLGLDPSTQSGFGRIIPGARWPVDLPSMGLLETLRLYSLDVNVDRSQDGTITEKVQVQLTSLGQLGF